MRYLERTGVAWLIAVLLPGSLFCLAAADEWAADEWWRYRFAIVVIGLVILVFAWASYPRTTRLPLVAKGLISVAVTAISATVWYFFVVLPVGFVAVAFCSPFAVHP